MTRTVAGPEAELDAVLGGWAESARWCAEQDSAERFPAEICSRLDAYGLHRYYVPAEWGGAFDDHEVMLRLWRTAARRDLSATVAHGKTYLGVAPVWIAGSPEQVAATAKAVLAGAPVACALSEPDHGADLLNGSVTATANGAGYRLDGVKWPINNGTRSTHVTVLARTAPAGTARGYSMFLVEKAALAPGTWRMLPKVFTHGLRGIDLSGIEFSGAAVDSTALLGIEGTGVETALRALQLTRTVCAAMSLGAGEQALRIAAPHADGRYARSVLARSAALLAAAEAASLVGVRSIHSLTGEMSVTSAVVKSVAPALVDMLTGELADVLGLRAQLVDGPDHGAFQRLARDHEVVSVFDGSTPVNRASLVQQFPRLARNITRGVVDADGLAEAVAIGDRPRPLDRSLLSLSSRHGCSVVQSLPALAESAGTWGEPGLAGHAAALRESALRLAAAMARVRPAARPPMLAYELAAAYELCFAGAASLHLWATRADRHVTDPLWRDGLWVRAALRAVSASLATVLRTPPPDLLPGDGELDELLADRVTEAARHGGAVTPFGAPLPASAPEVA